MTFIIIFISLEPYKLISSMKIILFLIYAAFSQQQVALVTTNQTTVMYDSTASSPYNDSFIQITSFFNCSLSVLYTYQQNSTQLSTNTQYYIKLYNLTEVTTIYTTTTYSIFSPSLNASSCQPGTQCTVGIRNNCPNPVDYFNYFDRVNIHVQGLTPLTYNVICDSDFIRNTFEWGLLIEIIFVAFLISIVAIYSKAWSIGGSGITITIPWIVSFNVILIIGGVIAAFSLYAVNVAVEVLSWFFGIFGVGLCFNELIFLLKLDVLRVGFKVKGKEVRVMDGISLLVGLGVCLGWWFSNNNWIVNDVVALCMTVAFIKVLKFTSLKMAIISFASTITVEMVFVILINFVIEVSYNNIILNEFNNPFELQVPTINAVYNQKCAWLPITSIVYPGMLMSYMRRFDTSRNTNVYLITCIVLFLVGSLLWMFVSVVSPHSWPFGLIAEPSMLGLVAFFAWKRKEIRTLWEGKFYDEEFANKQALNTISEMIERERRDTRISYEESMFRGLHLGNEESGIERSVIKTRKEPSQI